ncbi:MAG: LacI family transcriptional regulator [Oscillospiraceae bacterium]|nr:LacI family transcriptional regulator [Oscillospiraceae bacterium]
MAKTTIRDVAERAGVSLSTVSRALNGNTSVDPAMAKRVQDAAKELGYIGSAHASAGTKRIAVVVPALVDTYFTIILAGIIDTAAENGQEVVVMHSRSDPDYERQCFERLVRSGVDGIIFSGLSDWNPLEDFPTLRGVPIVVAARRKIIPGVPHIYDDNVAAGYLATKYMLRLRRRNIALMVNFWMNNIVDYDAFIEAYHSPAQGTCTAFDRYTGYVQALEEEGLSVDPSLIVFSGFSPASGYESAQQLLANPREFDGVLVPNDRSATGVLRMLREQGLSVPQQVSMICFNGGLIANVVTPALTMIEQNNYELGVQAATQMNEMLCGREGHDVKLDVRLSIKGSTALAED